MVSLTLKSPCHGPKVKQLPKIYQVREDMEVGTNRNSWEDRVSARYYDERFCSIGTKSSKP